ncbi:MAG: MerR family transcriptional regulator [Sphingomonadales bacterium]|nr:MerR family transcriptional regulator [Sphingomonadales bacterium]
MKIGDLSKDIGLSIQTIRFYEKEGLIGSPERTEGRFRIFSVAQRNRLAFIKTLRLLGFSLDEVRLIVGVSEGSVAGAADVIAQIKEKVLWRQDQLSALAAALDASIDGKLPPTIEEIFAPG